jgi:phosphate starvation-inducible PhoH-like protein
LNKKEDLILTVIGPAGSGKTFLACLDAINRLKEQKIKKIVITRPAVSVDEDLGFLPGNIDKKMFPWTKPMFDVFLKFYSKSEINNMLANDLIEICPLCFMRGRTFDDSFIIADEMQNSTPNQMLMLLTRIGSNSRMVITGDLVQSDRINDNGLRDLVNKLKHKNNSDNLFLLEMDNEDIHRSELVNKVLNIYKPNDVMIYNKCQNLTILNNTNTITNTNTSIPNNTSTNSRVSKKEQDDCAIISLNDYKKLKKHNKNI